MSPNARPADATDPRPDPATSDPATSRRDGLIALAIAGIVLLTVIVSHLAPGASAPRAAADPSADVSCAEWGDGCRVCQRGPGGPVCSLPGIACVAGATRCLSRAGG